MPYFRFIDWRVTFGSIYCIYALSLQMRLLSVMSIFKDEFVQYCSESRKESIACKLYAWAPNDDSSVNVFLLKWTEQWGVWLRYGHKLAIFHQLNWFSHNFALSLPMASQKSIFINRALEIWWLFAILTQRNWEEYQFYCSYLEIALRVSSYESLVQFKFQYI